MRNRALIGASILSGAGAIPVHLAPVIVAVLVADGLTSVGNAGVVASMILLGMLVMALLLPMVNAWQITKPATGIASCVLVASLMLSSSFLLMSWFVIGLCCGLFQYVGTLTAALHARPGYAFPVRLGLSLCLSGTTVAALQLMPVTSYAAMLLMLACVFGFLLTIGVSLQEPIQRPPSKVGRAPETWRAYAVLAAVFLLFVGQTGLLAYVIQQATERGFLLGQAMWAIGMMKVVAGVILLALRSARFDLWPLSIALAVANIVVTSTTSLPMFVVAFLLLEIGFNLLAAKLQALAAHFAPFLAGKWLVAVVLLGAAIGPVLHGYAIAGELAFVYLAVLSAIVPMTLRRVTTDR